MDRIFTREDLLIISEIAACVLRDARMKEWVGDTLDLSDEALDPVLEKLLRFLYKS